jgi:hypothetical protein
MDRYNRYAPKGKANDRKVNLVQNPSAVIPPNTILLQRFEVV